MAATLPNFGTAANVYYGIPDLYAADPDLFAERTVANSVGYAIVDTGFNMGANKVWENPNEVVDGTDTDGNFMVDDINGWNFYNDDHTFPYTNSHANNVVAAAKAPGPEWCAFANVIIGTGEFDPSAAEGQNGMWYGVRTSGIKITNCSYAITGTPFATTILPALSAGGGFLVGPPRGGFVAYMDEVNDPYMVTTGAVDIADFTQNHASETTGDNTNTLFGAFSSHISYSSPVAGSVIAMLWCKDPSLTRADIRSALVAGCRHEGNTDTYLKYGVLSHKRSYEAAFGSLTATQVFIGKAFGGNVESIAKVNGRDIDTIAAVNGRDVRARRRG